MLVFVSPHPDAWATSDEVVGTLEGELVSLWDCPTDCDDNCPGVMFSGFESHSASSVAVVADRPDINPAVLEFMVTRDLVRRGWVHEPLDQESAAWVQDIVQECIEYPRSYEPGTIVERTLTGVVARGLAHGFDTAGH